MADMVVIDGFRYKPAEAKRILARREGKPDQPKRRPPRNKARKAPQPVDSKTESPR